MPDSANPLISDRDVDFVLDEVLDAQRLCELPYFRDHSRETFAMLLHTTRRLAREVLFPSYKPTDEAPPVFRDGRVHVHPRLKEIYPQLAELGLIAANRPAEVGGQQFPMLVTTLASAYLMAGNLSAYGYLGLTAGAAHLLGAFGSEEQQRRYMDPLLRGEWTGTMALTEPQAGSSLADVQTKAVPTGRGDYLLQGSKIFISGGDHDLTENVVQMVLARLEGAPAGIKGVSLFVVPKMRQENGALVPNDVRVTGLIHKIGWKGLPSLALAFGESGDCHGELVGKPNQGIAYMFQMMNEARLMVGCNGVATASVAYHEALAYARERTQGRPATARDPKLPQIPIIEHADVRRMLLRQKAIVEGGLGLLAFTAMQADLAAHAVSEEERHRAHLMLDLLTPLTKTFPAEWGFEANALAVQIHGGYGYSSEYLPESWLRDQKLNSIHEGTSGIQALDLLGRKVVAEGGAALQLLQEQIAHAVERAQRAGVDPAWGAALTRWSEELAALTMQLAGFGLEGRVDEMLRHSTDYLHLVAIGVVAWQWLLQAAAAKEGLARGEQSPGFYEGKLYAAQYWLHTELPKTEALFALCRSGEDSYAKMRPEWF